MKALASSMSRAGFVLIAAALFTCLTRSSCAQNFYPNGEDAIQIWNDDDGPLIRVVDSKSSPQQSDCHFDYKVTTGSGKIRSPRFALVLDANNNLQVAVIFTRSDKSVHIVLSSQFVHVCDPALAGDRSATAAPASINADVTVSNDADVVAVTCNGRFAVVVGSTDSMTPVSVVDLTSKQEVDTFTFNGTGTYAAACDDAQSVLIVLDNNTGTAGAVRRFTVSAAGALNDTGETLALGSASVFITKVFAVPGSKTGLALVTEFFTASPPVSRLVSFRIPGLQVLDSVTLADRLGNAAAISCTGQKIFARSGRRLPDDTIEGFTFDPDTGLIGNTASPTITGVSFVNVTNFENPLALTSDGEHLLVPEPEASPSPQFAIFDATTGARLGNMPGDPPAQGEVQGEIHVFPCCGLGGLSSARPDFNRDGFTDYLLFNPTNRATAIWNLEGPTFLSGVYGPALPASWTLACVADINQNGSPDYILFNSSTRRTAIWYLNGSIFAGSAYGPTLPAGWTLIAATDFNGDSKPDYVLFNPATRQTALWHLNGAVFTSGIYGPTLPSGWTLTDALDFNANGKPDFLLFRSSTRQTAIWHLNFAAFASGVYGSTLPSGWTLEGAADFNADAKPDCVLFQPSSRRTALWYLNGGTLTGSAYGPTLASGYSLVSP